MTSPTVEFHRAFGLPTPDTHPLRPDTALLQLRLRLINEEHKEVTDEIEKLLGMTRAKKEPDDYLPVYRDLLKELSDLRYVVEGTATALGLPGDEAYLEVHRSNMSKLGPDGQPIHDDGGKVLKGPNYEEADMTKYIPDYIDV